MSCKDHGGQGREGQQQPGKAEKGSSSSMRRMSSSNSRERWGRAQQCGGVRRGSKMGWGGLDKRVQG